MNKLKIYFPIFTLAGERYQREIMHIRHHSLFAPRDFDVSSYFEIIKPSLNKDFDFHKLKLRHISDN